MLLNFLVVTVSAERPTRSANGLHFSGVQVEEIRQENKLWTNDSLYLRPHLNIPIPRTSPNSSERSQEEGKQLASRSETPSKALASDGGLDKSSVSSLFSSFDAQLAELKGNVKQLEKSSSTHLAGSA